MEQNLTVGNPERLLWRFCLPLLGSMLFQQLYNIADTIVAGNYIGESALAAVGNSYEITLAFISVSVGCNMGCSVIVSRLYGANRIREMKTAISTAMIASAVICVVFTVAGLFLSPILLTAIRTPADVFQDSLLYLRIYVFGFPFVLFYNISNGIFSAVGDSRTPFIFLACSSVGNILLDILLVVVFDWGIAGIAWATFLCQCIGCVLAVGVVIRRLQKMISDEPAERFSSSMLKSFGRTALPSVCQQIVVPVGNIIIQSIINGYGSAVMAGFCAGIKLISLVTGCVSTLCNGIAAFTAQNIGANKPQRVKYGLRVGIKMTWAFCIPIMLLYWFWGEPLVRFFIEEPTTESLVTGVEILRAIGSGLLIVSVKHVLDSILRGAGKMSQFLFVTVAGLFLRVVLAYILPELMGSTVGIWLAWPIGWLLSTCISFLFYLNITRQYSE